VIRTTHALRKQSSGFAAAIQYSPLSTFHGNTLTPKNFTPFYSNDSVTAFTTEVTGSPGSPVLLQPQQRSERAQLKAFPFNGRARHQGQSPAAVACHWQQHIPLPSWGLEATRLNSQALRQGRIDLCTSIH